MPERLPLFATASRGTEPYLVKELQALGASRVKQDRGGVRFFANIHEIMRLLVHSRLAMRVLYPVGEAEAVGKDGLYEAARSVPWEEHLTPDTTFAVEATLKDSEHNHSGFVALRVKDAIADRLRETKGRRPNVDTRKPDVAIVVHLNKTKLSMSLDLAGEPLHRRGYRVEQTVAPLKETLAAAVLAGCNYLGEEPFADPMCGSGTLVVEAAMIACRKAPGARRRFAVEQWPQLGEQARKLVAEFQKEAIANERALPFPFTARDREEEAVHATKFNLKAAGIQGVTVELGDALAAPPPEGQAGLLASNPPYGDRLTAGGQKGMKSFYFHLGDSLSSWTGWRMGFLVGNEAFESAFHMRPAERIELWNGPIECRLFTYPARTPRTGR